MATVRGCFSAEEGRPVVTSKAKQERGQTLVMAASPFRSRSFGVGLGKEGSRGLRPRRGGGSLRASLPPA